MTIRNVAVFIDAENLFKGYGKFEIPEMSMAIKAGAPRLSPSDARVSTLSRALRFALAGTQYALARESDDAQPVLVRRGDDPPGILPDLSLDDIERGVQ